MSFFSTLMYRFVKIFGVSKSDKSDLTGLTDLSTYNIIDVKTTSFIYLKEVAFLYVSSLFYATNFSV